MLASCTCRDRETRVSCRSVIGARLVSHSAQSQLDTTEESRGVHMTILVTGATGTIGGAVVPRLVEAGQKVRALTRDASRAEGLHPSTEIAEGDLGDPEGMRRALHGVDRMYLFADSENVEETLTAVEECGVRRLVVLTSPLGNEEDQNGKTYNVVKAAVRARSLDWTFVEPGPFSMNARDWWAAQIQFTGAVNWVYPEAALAPIHEEDIADLIAQALLEDGHIGQAYEISGPEILTQREQVNIIGDVLGRAIPFHDIGQVEARNMMVSHGVPSEIAHWVLEVLAERARVPTHATNPVERFTGRPGRTFAQWVSEHADDFRTPG